MSIFLLRGNQVVIKLSSEGKHLADHKLEFITFISLIKVSWVSDFTPFQFELIRFNSANLES